GGAKAVGGEDAFLGEPVRESKKGFFIEARHRRPAELVIDQKPDRVRADIDDRVRGPVDPPGALGIEFKRAWRRLRLPSASLRHRFSSRRELITGGGVGLAPAVLLSFRLFFCSRPPPALGTCGAPAIPPGPPWRACPAPSPARRSRGRTASEAGQGRWGLRF